MTDYKTFRIAVPTDDKGFIGRACDNCKQYFKVYLLNLKDETYCPYCGTRCDKSSLLTSDQKKYATEAIKEEARAYAVKELQKMFKNTFGSSSARTSGIITYKPGEPYRKRPIHPHYQEREVDTELQCPICDTRFQVYGIFGYCPSCRTENLTVYDANWDIIKKEVESTDNPQRELRHAYGDLVSTFEAFCKRKAVKLSNELCNFQMLFEARRFFKNHAGVDILDGLSAIALLALRRVFAKRHACVHSGGQITEKYVKMIPEDSNLLGQKVMLNFAELEEAATAIRSALATLVKSIEKPG